MEKTWKRTYGSLDWKNASDEELNSQIDKLRKQGYDINKFGFCGVTALYMAVRYGRTNLVERLVKLGAKIENDFRGRYIVYPLLHVAAENGHTETVQKLVELGASVDKHGERALCAAIESGYTKTAKKLIDLGADFREVKNYSLDGAAMKGSTAGIQTLIDLGIDTSMNIDYPLRHAVERGHLETVKMLIELFGPKVSDEVINLARNEQMKEILTHAEELRANYLKAHPEKAKMWDETWGRIDWWNRKRTDAEISKDIDKLLAIGADINAKDTEGNTILHSAARSGRTEVVQKLIDLGMDVNTRNDNSETPLLCMDLPISKGVAMKLIELGADINAKDFNGNTILHKAARFKYTTDLVQKLVDLGMDIDVRNNDGETPLLCTSGYYLEKEILMKLVEQGADINATNDNGETALMKQIQCRDNADTIKYLIELGADVKIRDIRGKTLLQRTRDAAKKSLILNADQIRADYLAAHPEDKQNARKTQKNTDIIVPKVEEDEMRKKELARLPSEAIQTLNDDIAQLRKKAQEELEAKIRELEKKAIEARKQQIEARKKQIQEELKRRKEDPLWQAVCSASKVLVASHQKEHAKILIQNYLKQHQK